MLATLCYEWSKPITERFAIDGSRALPGRIMRWYYAGTIVFLLLDYVGGLNIRVAFLAGAGGLRAAYYGLCFVCLGLMIWRPAWTVVISAFESLVTLVALIVSFGTRAILVSDAMLAGSEPFISMPEIINFLMSGSIAYLAWARGMAEFQKSLR